MNTTLKKIIFFILANIVIISFAVIGKDVAAQFWSDYTLIRVEKSIQKNYHKRKVEIEELVAYVEPLFDKDSKQYIGVAVFPFTFSFDKSDFFSSNVYDEPQLIPATIFDENQQQELKHLLRKANCDGIIVEEDGDIRIIYDGTMNLYHYEYLFLKNKNGLIPEHYLQLDKDVYCGLYDIGIICGLWFFSK